MALAALLPLREAAATCSGSAGNGVAEQVGNVNCTVDATHIPTTVTFQSGATGKLILNAAAPTGLINNAVNTEGSVDVQGTVTLNADIGVADLDFPHRLAAINILDAAVLNTPHNVVALTLTVGQGTSGTLNQTAQTISVRTLVLNDGATLDQGMQGSIRATLGITLGNNATLTLRSSETGGTINGIADGQGTLIIDHEFTSEYALGGTHRLHTITVNSGATLSLIESSPNTGNATADTVNVNGTLNQSAGTLTATTLALGNNASVTQTGSGVINAATTLGSGATLSLRNQGSGAINGAADGQGTLSFTGSYNTDAAIGATHGLAAINVNDGVTLTLDQNASATSVTVGQGASGIVNQSAGTLSATTLAINAGGTYTQSGGSISASALNVHGSFTHEGGSLSALALAIKNGGVFNQNGSAGITAATTIYDGGTFNVNSGFTHTGALTLGSGSSGVLKLNSHTVNVSSGFTMLAGSTLKTTIHADSANAAGRIVADGPASVAANTSISITVLPATLTVGQSYLLVSGAAGSVVEVPASIISSNPDYEFVAASDGKSLSLTTRAAASYRAAAQSANTSAIAGALDAARTSGTADMRDVLAQLNSLSGSAAKDAAMASMAPLMENAVPLASTVVQGQVFGTIDARLESLRNSGVGGPSGFSSGNPADGVGIWLQTFGDRGTQQARQGASGFKVNTRGLAFSADTVLPDDRWTVGVSFAHAASSIGFRDARSGSSSDVSSNQASVYASYEGHAFYLDAIANMGTNAYTSERLISVGAITRRALGDYKGRQYSARATAGFPVQRGSMVVTPLASLEYTHLRLDAYSETGAGAIDLHVDERHYDSLQLGLGASVRFDSWLGNGKLVPTVRAMWIFEGHDDRQTLNSSFTGGGGSSFSTSAPDAARHSLKLGLGMNYKVGRNTTWALNYDARLKDGFVGHAGMLTFHHQF
ncbi:MAG: autotransporter domain-containing protein [Pseudomonadota bacterium]